MSLSIRDRIALLDPPLYVPADIAGLPAEHAALARILFDQRRRLLAAGHTPTGTVTVGPDELATPSKPVALLLQELARDGRLTVA